MLKQTIALVTLLVYDYDEAIDFYTKCLGFNLVEDAYQSEQNKRWVVVSPPESGGASLLFAKATTAEQTAAIGKQAGDRVFLFLNTDDFYRDYNAMLAMGVVFVREPIEEVYGTVAVFEDLYGNRWDLIQRQSESED